MEAFSSIGGKTDQLLFMKTNFSLGVWLGNRKDLEREVIVGICNLGKPSSEFFTVDIADYIKESDSGLVLLKSVSLR